VLSSTGPTHVITQRFTLVGTNVLSFVGGMSVIFATASEGTFADVISMGVIGLGNESVGYPGTLTSSACLIGYSLLTLIALVSFVFLQTSLLNSDNFSFLS